MRDIEEFKKQIKRIDYYYEVAEKLESLEFESYFSTHDFVINILIDNKDELESCRKELINIFQSWNDSIYYTYNDKGCVKCLLSDKNNNVVRIIYKMQLEGLV
jgi:hypothetical protein